LLTNYCRGKLQNQYYHQHQASSSIFDPFT